MKRIIRWLLPILGIAIFTGVSTGQSQEVEKIKALLSELNTIKAAVAQEQKAQAGLEADNKLLEGQDKTIKSLESQYKKDLPVFEMDVAAYKADNSSFEAGKSAYIAKYGCWDCSSVKMSKENSKASWAEVRVLNTQLDRLKTEGNKLDAKWAELEKTKKLVQEGKETLSKATLDWWAKKKASNAQMLELIASYQKLTKTYTDLMERAKLGEECKQIAYSSDRAVVQGGRVVGRQSGVIDFNELNGAMERAHRCLQQVWDGASAGDTKPVQPKPPFKATPNQ